jgi:hypothetical protein
MLVVKRGNKNAKSIAYKSLVRPILEYGTVCWDPYRECQINAFDRVQNKAAKFAHHTGGLDWESLAQRRKIAHMCALFKAYKREMAWKAIGDTLQAPGNLSRVDHNWKIRARKQRTDVDKCVMYCCHRVSAQMRLNISYHICKRPFLSRFLLH